MFSMNEFGNNLYSGKTSFPFVGKRRLWFVIAILLVVGSALVPLIRPVQFSIEFTGGSQFVVLAPSSTDQALATEGGDARDQQTVADVVEQVLPGSAPRISLVGQTDVRVQTDQMTPGQTQDVKGALADAYDVKADEITDSFIGPAWGENVTRQSLWGLAIFLALTFLIGVKLIWDSISGLI